MNPDPEECSLSDERPVLVGEQAEGTVAVKRARPLSGDSPFAYRVGKTAGTREMKALVLLASFRYLTRFQLEELLFDAHPERLGPHEVMTRRVLKRLQDERLITAYPRIVGGAAGGSGRTVYSPSAAGLKVVRSFCPGLPARESGSRRPFLLQHSLATAEVALAFQRSARQVGHQLVEWECDWSAAERLGAGAVVPDAHLVYATAEYEVEAFVEVDIGTERTRFFGEKLRRYVELYRSGTWRSHLRSWPVVLVVVPDDRRAFGLVRLAEVIVPQAADPPTAVEFWVGQAEYVVTEPLGVIWHVVGREGGYALLPSA
jgi:hypothetical protein